MSSQVQNSDFEIGTSYLNNAYFLTTNANHNGTITSTASNPYAWEQGYYARYVYHAPNSPLAGYANLWQKHASATNSTYIDSRFSVVDRATSHDVVRFSVGNTTTQPSQDMLEQKLRPEQRHHRGGRRCGYYLRRPQLRRYGPILVAATRTRRGRRGFLHAPLVE